MNEEESRKIIDNMSEQELNDFIFFALQEVEKENQKLKAEIEKKDKLIKVMAKDYVCKRKCNLEDKKNKYANCIECLIDFYERKVNNE